MPGPPGRAPVVIAGGSGFLGISLATHLAESGTPVIILSRHAPTVTGPWRHVPWDARTLGGWSSVLNGAAGVVNLVGRSVDCIKTPANKDIILRSRVDATLVLGQAMRDVAHPPPVWVQMSTAHIYGDPTDREWRSESSAPGTGFAPDVGAAWEHAFESARLPDQRPVILRTSFVVGQDRGAGGGALSRLRTLVRLGLGGTVGTGEQGMSWIHERDMNRLFERALVEERMTGMYIATAPNPVSQREFMRTLRKAMRVPIGLPAPAFMVRIGAPLLMRTDPELAIYGRYVRSERLAADGFQFEFETIERALADLVARPGS
jgi:uncharacterized protein (TIGR01777 family)